MAIRLQRTSLDRDYAPAGQFPVTGIRSVHTIYNNLKPQSIAFHLTHYYKHLHQCMSHSRSSTCQEFLYVPWLLFPGRLASLGKEIGKSMCPFFCTFDTV